jgi:hypothetical protein
MLVSAFFIWSFGLFISVVIREDYRPEYAVKSIIWPIELCIWLYKSARIWWKEVTVDTDNKPRCN